MLSITKAQAAALVAAAGDAEAAWLLDPLGSRGEVLGAYRLGDNSDSVPSIFLDESGGLLKPETLYSEVKGMKRARDLEFAETRREDESGYVSLEQAGDDLYDLVRYRPTAATLEAKP